MPWRESKRSDRLRSSHLLPEDTCVRPATWSGQAPDDDPSGSSVGRPLVAYSAAAVFLTYRHPFELYEVVHEVRHN